MYFTDVGLSPAKQADARREGSLRRTQMSIYVFIYLFIINTRDYGIVCYETHRWSLF